MINFDENFTVHQMSQKFATVDGMLNDVHIM